MKNSKDWLHFKDRFCLLKWPHLHRAYQVSGPYSFSKTVCSAYYLMTVSPFFLILAVPHLWIPLDKAPQFNDESLLRAVRSRYFSLWKLMASLCPPALKLVANISNGKYISSAFLTGSFGQEKKTWEIHTHNRNLHCHK